MLYYTQLANRLRTVGGSNNSHHTGVVEPLYERWSTVPLSAKVVYPRFQSIREFSSIRELSNWGHLAIFIYFLVLNIINIEDYNKFITIPC